MEIETRCGGLAACGARTRERVRGVDRHDHSESFPYRHVGYIRRDSAGRARRGTSHRDTVCAAQERRAILRADVERLPEGRSWLREPQPGQSVEGHVLIRAATQIMPCPRQCDLERREL